MSKRKGAWCAECGPISSVDSDGLCSACGATCLGDGADRAIESLAELERLRDVLRQTHERHCTDAWTSRGLHAPDCLAFEVEP
jgi:hypothetical protein